MSALPKLYVTPEEYLALERASESKSEYWNGEIYAMAGASARHNLITINVGATLHTQLRGRSYHVFLSDMRIKIPATGLYTYADVTVVCGKPQLEDCEMDTLLNPTIIVEVLSKSTESYDRGKKFQNYRSLPSLREYLLIAQDDYHIEHYLRQPDDQWLLTDVHDPQGGVVLPPIDYRLTLADVYAQVELTAGVDLRDRNQRAR